MDAQSAPVIAEICRRLDGLPLAIELAASRIRILSPQALLARLTHRLQLLTGGPRDVVERHQTLRDAIAWSYDLLDPDEQRLFRELAVFPGGWTLEAAEWIDGAGTDGSEGEAATLDRLEALLDQSMVVRDVGIDGEPRFRMLETIRAFGLEQLTEEEEAAVRDRHAHYFRSLTQALRPIVVT